MIPARNLTDAVVYSQILASLYCLCLFPQSFLKKQLFLSKNPEGSPSGWVENIWVVPGSIIFNHHHCPSRDPRQSTTFHVRVTFWSTKTDLTTGRGRFCSRSLQTSTSAFQSLTINPNFCFTVFTGICRSLTPGGHLAPSCDMPGAGTQTEPLWGFVMTQPSVCVPYSTGRPKLMCK